MTNFIKSILQVHLLYTECLQIGRPSRVYVIRRYFLCIWIPGYGDYMHALGCSKKGVIDKFFHDPYTQHLCIF